MDQAPHSSDASHLTDAQIDAAIAAQAAGMPPERPRRDAIAEGAAVARLRVVIGAMQDGAIEQAPAALIDRLVRLERQVRMGEALDRVADVVTGAVRAFVAGLTYDSRVSPALAGFRGSAGATQLVFSCEAGEVHLHVAESAASSDSRVTVRGVVEPAGDVAAEPIHDLGSVELTPAEADGQAIRAALDEDSMFVLRVAPGAYGVVLLVRDARIDLGVLELP